VCLSTQCLTSQRSGMSIIGIIIGRIVKSKAGNMKMRLQGQSIKRATATNRWINFHAENA